MMVRARRSAETKMYIATSKKPVAMAFGSQLGSIVRKSALKPRPIPTRRHPRTHPS